MLTRFIKIQLVIFTVLTVAAVVWARPAIGAASAMSAASTAPGRPILGVSSQITPPPTRSVSESTRPSTRSPSSSRHHSTTASTTLP